MFINNRKNANIYDYNSKKIKTKESFWHYFLSKKISHRILSRYDHIDFYTDLVGVASISNFVVIGV